MTPIKIDKCDFSNGSSQARADVFFIHGCLIPTSDSDDKNIDSRKASESMISFAQSQVSVFNGACKIYAPFYRNAIHSAEHDSNFLDIAYSDVERAFRVFIQVYNKDRPFYLAGHGQGAT